MKEHGVMLGSSVGHKGPSYCIVTLLVWPVRFLIGSCPTRPERRISYAVEQATRTANGEVAHVAVTTRVRDTHRHQEHLQPKFGVSSFRIWGPASHLLSQPWFPIPGSPPLVPHARFSPLVANPSFPTPASCSWFPVLVPHP